MSADLSWLSDIGKPLVIQDKSWRKKQQQLRSLPMWFYEPPDRVKAILMYLRTGEGMENIREITDRDWEDIRYHLEIDCVAFIWFFCFLKDRNTRRKELATPTAPQLALLWRFAYLVHEDQPVRISLLKERQGGFSWIICSIVLWIICFRKHVNALHVAHDKKTTQRIFRYLKDGHEWLGPHIRPMKRASSRNELELGNPDEHEREMGNEGQDSRAYVDTAGNDFAGTAEAVQVAHVSELGKWDKLCDPEVIWTSFANAMQDEPGTFVFAESTAHGARTFWHEHWLSSLKMGSAGWNGYTPIFLPWYLDERNVRPAPPDMVLGNSDDHEFGNEVYLKTHFDLTLEQLMWRRWSIMKQPEGRPKIESFNQEHPGTHQEAWLFAHGRWLAATVVETASARCQYEIQNGMLKQLFVGDIYPLREKGRDLGPLIHGTQNEWLHRRALGPFTVYRWPDWRHNYIVSADISEGIQGGDASCVKVWQREPFAEPTAGFPSDNGRHMRICAEWYGLLGEDLVADIMWRLGWLYSTGRGEYRVPALLAWERTGPGRSLGMFLRRGRTSDDGYPHSRLYRRHEPDMPGYLQDGHYGVSTNRATKPTMMAMLERAVREGDVQLLPKDIEELGQITRDDRGLLETGGKDRVMSIAIALYAAAFSAPVMPRDAQEPETLLEHSVKWSMAVANKTSSSYDDTETDEVILT